MSRARPPEAPPSSGATIILFPKMPCVVIISRMIEETKRVTCDGSTLVRHDPPLLAYFIDYQDKDDFNCCVWDGFTYDGALAVARTWAEEGVAVCDRTRETRWRG